ncbi:NACHT domain-containing protein [Dactylosporangium sp. NPDC005555]|uniref:NACHT domain-containing protein n=1 Tax=Dactylosporangium sp. NPDC005555 TaxID=3154889 RepID=UPI0033AB37DB
MVLAVRQRAWVSEHPVLAIIMTVACLIASVTVGFTITVVLAVLAAWSLIVADKVNETTGRLFSRYRRAYLRYLRERYHDVDMRGLTIRGSYTFSMKQIFVDLALLPTPTHRASNGLTRPRRRQGALSPDEARRMSVVEWLGRSRFTPLVIVGAPGSGKTTLIKHVTLSLCQGSARDQLPANLRNKVPVVVVLRDVAHEICKNPNMTLAEVVYTTLTKLPAKPSGWLEHQLRLGRCIVMFDGLDEVSRDGARGTVVHWVQEQINNNLDNYFVLTSRPKGYQDHPLEQAVIVEVQPFTEAQIEEFIGNWYAATHRRATDRWDQGVAEQTEQDAADLFGRLREKAQLLDLSQNPLLLTMVALVHFYRGALPGTRVELYREICQVFLGKRQEAKGIQSPHTTVQKEVVLRVLAYSMMCQGVRELRATDAGSVIQDALARVQYDAGSREFLEDIERGSGILVERESGVYSFAHLTFQEYLAAAHANDASLVQQMCTRVTDPWWSETVLLYVAQADAAPIVAACLSSTNASHELFMLAADCINEAKEISPELTRYLDAPSTGGIDAHRGRRLMQVMLLRKVRNSVRLRGGGYLCASPLTNREYRFFLNDSGEYWRQPDHWEGHDLPPANASAVGMRRSDAESFVTWVAQLQLDIRLPTMDELMQLKSPPIAWASQPDGRPACTTRPTSNQQKPSSCDVNLLQLVGDDYFAITSVSRATFSARLGAMLETFAEVLPETALLQAVHKDLLALASPSATGAGLDGLAHALDAFTRTWGRREHSDDTPHFYPIQVIERSRQLAKEETSDPQWETGAAAFFHDLERRLRKYPTDVLQLDDSPLTAPLAQPDLYAGGSEFTQVFGLALRSSQAALDRQAQLPGRYRQKVRAVARLACVDSLRLLHMRQATAETSDDTALRRACEQQLVDFIVLHRRLSGQLPATETLFLVRN